MPYVVHWVPRGPDMTAACETMADLLELTSELTSSGRAIEMRITQGEQELDVDAVRAMAARSDARSG